MDKRRCTTGHADTVEICRAVQRNCCLLASKRRSGCTHVEDHHPSNN